jgi:DNA (cytosine-5)-methyltransferase 1
MVPRSAQRPQPTFVDVFAGCGGLTLGLLQAGWKGMFAIERDRSPFDTFSQNLLSGSMFQAFDWPDWLPQEPICATTALEIYRSHLMELGGHVDMLVGGPPCQGFSSAGRRDPDDPRNRLFESYLRYVHFLRPRIILIENVRGMTLDFRDPANSLERLNYSDRLRAALCQDYDLHTRMIDVSTFGVPQTRTRFFMIGFRKDHKLPAHLAADPFAEIELERQAFLCSKLLTAPTCARAAISDLEVNRNGTVDSPESVGFRAIDYTGPITPYQRLMRINANGPPSDTRLANHRQHITDRFKEIITECHRDGRLNVSLTRESREGYGLKKQAIRVLDPDRPAPTVTSMPDDLIHYAEPRALTVRENARLQSFPDWFEFKGQYTTGGHRRRHEVPRFTQVANAVPPLAAEAIGSCLLHYV